jgi:hypothetical protein
MIAEMTAAVLFRYGALSSRGTSDTASFITKQAQEGRQKWLETHTFGQQVRASIIELWQLFQDCRFPNWDAYGAEPVSEEAFKLAYQLLKVLPLGTPAASFGAEPDGHITLEWYRSPRRTLSVSVSPEGELHYAALVGASKHYGTEPFYGEAPKAIVDLIYRVLAA